MKRLIRFALLWAIAWWAGPAWAQSGEPFEWQLAGAEWSGPLSSAAIDATVTARDQRSWNILWQMIGEDSPGPLPEGRMAIAIFKAPEKGEERFLEITEVVAGETALVIGFRDRLASKENLTADRGDENKTDESGFFAPYIVRLVPVSQLPVYYVGTVEAVGAE